MFFNPEDVISEDDKKILKSELKDIEDLIQK
jgi:hypothetical protein